MSENPLIDIADETAEGPGSGTIFMLFFMHSFTNNAPGSDIVGVPASEIIDMISPDFNKLIIFGNCFFSLNL